MMGVANGTDAVSVTEILADLAEISLPLTSHVGVSFNAASDEQFDSLAEPSWRSYSSADRLWKAADAGRVHLSAYAPYGYRERHADLDRRAAVKNVLADITDVDDELADRVVRAALKETR